MDNPLFFKSMYRMSKRCLRIIIITIIVGIFLRQRIIIINFIVIYFLCQRIIIIYIIIVLYTFYINELRPYTLFYFIDISSFSLILNTLLSFHLVFHLSIISHIIPPFFIINELLLYIIIMHFY